MTLGRRHRQRIYLARCPVQYSLTIRRKLGASVDVRGHFQAFQSNINVEMVSDKCETCCDIAALISTWPWPKVALNEVPRQCSHLSRVHDKLQSFRGLRFRRFASREEEFEKALSLYLPFSMLNAAVTVLDTQNDLAAVAVVLIGSCNGSDSG